MKNRRIISSFLASSLLLQSVSVGVVASTPSQETVQSGGNSSNVES